jgi:Major Facilitator Superfamily
MTSLGGTTYAWGSAPIAILGGAGIFLIALFVDAERRAPEPVLPLRLFSNRVFSVSSALGFVVGFAMFGAITFLPLYLQVVKGVNPTVSGLRLLPLMVGLLLTATTSGQLISRWGHYKIFPIIGTALMTIGLLLLSRLGPHTTGLLTSLYMFVFGLGLGAVMQVLIIAVQNAVDYKDLGAATSGVTYFRSIGGSFGTAVFGSIFSNALTANIAHFLGALRLPAGVSSASLSPRALSDLPPAVHHAFIFAYGSSFKSVFRAAAPVAAVGFVLAWLLPEAKLRKTVAATDPGETLGMPTDRTSLQELERAVAVLAQHQNRVAVYQRVSVQAGLEGFVPAPAVCSRASGSAPASRSRNWPRRSEHRDRPSRRSSSSSSTAGS